jgi:hypothetical protein
MEPGPVLGIDRGRASDRECCDSGDGEPSHVNLLGRLARRMGAAGDAINLQFGQNAPPYQDVIPMNSSKINHHIMPSNFGSHSEISGT